METILRLYAGWIWQHVESVDALVLWPPRSAPDDPKAFARELYHRYLAHLFSIRICRLEWLALLSSGVLVLLLRMMLPAIPVWAGFLLSLPAIGLATTLGTRAVIGWVLKTNSIEKDKQVAESLVKRVCLRDVANGTPDDLDDPWRHGWTTSDGRPIAAEIAETDLRSTDFVNRARSVFIAALVVGLIPWGLTPAAPIATTIILFLALLKLLTDPSPAIVRARLLDAAAAGTAEGAAWAFAGASRWAMLVEDARKAQMIEAIRDKSPLIHFGKALGVLAARGDMFAPTTGLDMVLSINDLMQHLLVLGGTGAGKTAGVLRPLCKQMGMIDNVGLVVLDGKGSLPGEVAKMIPDMLVIDPANNRMSLVEGLTPTEIVTTVSDLLGHTEGKDRFFEESAAGLMRHAAVLAKFQGGASWSLAGIWRIASEGPKADLLETSDLTVPEVREAVGFFQKEWPHVESEVKSSILATLRAWYTTITNHPDTLKWAETPAGKSDINIKTVLKGARIGMLAPAHRYGQAGPVVLALLKASLFAAIRDRADKGMGADETPVVLVMDEAQEVTTKQDALILSIARSLNLSIVASTQTVEGLQARLGKKEAAQYLTLFGSVIALQNRSARTAEAIAERLGASFRPILDAVPGVPTVRSAVTVQRASGRLAASMTQAPIAATICIGEGGRLRDLLSAINPFQLFRRTVTGEQERPNSRVEVKPFVIPTELSELVVEPDTALAIFTRARVPRRDIIKLEPIYS